LTSGGTLLAALALAGCSIGSDQKPRPSGRATNQIAQVVQELERATRKHDYRTICRDLFTAAAKRRSGGADCPRLLRSTAEGVQRPRIELLAVELRKGRAEAKVRSSATGQPPVEDTLELVPERGRYRIEALGG
jgi:hypothetical protein